MSQNQEIILKSRYKPSPISIPTTEGNKRQNVVEFLLEQAAENVKIGRTKWMTNSITGETLTFSDIEPLSRKIASAMYKRGMRQGDVVLYLTSDVTKIYVSMIGIWRLGGVLYSSYVEDTADQLTTRIKASKAKWIFCDSASIATATACVENVKEWSVEIILFDSIDLYNGKYSLISQLLEDDGKDCPSFVHTTLDDPVIILCTSGTTGLSKGAIYTNRSVLGFVLGTDAIPWSPKPALYLIKVTHVLGVLFPIRNINGGNWAIMMPAITKENVYKAVQEFKPFLVFGFPTYLMALVTDVEAQGYDRSSVEIMCTGGLVITETIYSTLLKLPSLKAVINGYGMTECGAVTTTIDLSYNQEIRAIPNLPPLTVGLLYPNTELKILDLSTGHSLGPGQHGEIVFKSPVACKGYLKGQSDTSGVVAEIENGWIHSGDLGYYDENGFLFIVDRIKETFKYFNNHISPVELEELLLQHPVVAEASVIGIVDPEGGDRIPRGFIVLKPEFKNKMVNTDEIKQFVDDKVANYKRFRGGLFIVDSLPKGKTGKVMRSLVAELPIPS